MLTILIQVDAPLGQAIGIKEALAMECERWGDTRVVSVVETEGEQLRMEVTEEDEVYHALPRSQVEHG